MISEHQKLSVGIRNGGEHGRGLRMMQRRGNKVSVGVFILSKTEISIITLGIHSALFHCTFAADLLTLLL